MNIPRVGEFEKDDALGWYFGPRKPIPVLHGEEARIVLDGYDGDRRPEDFHAAVTNFFSISEAVLKEAEPFVFQYYQDCTAAGGASVTIASPADVWRHVRFGDEPQVLRRAYGDRGMYVSCECECDWEKEHGLQLVFKNGLAVSKVGEYDGHVTNADAYNDPRFEDVVYVDRATVLQRIAARNKRQKRPKATKKAQKATKATKKVKRGTAKRLTAKKGTPKKGTPKKRAAKRTPAKRARK